MNNTFKTGDRIRALVDDSTGGWRVGDEFYVFVTYSGEPYFADKAGTHRSLIHNDGYFKLITFVEVPSLESEPETIRPSSDEFKTLRDEFAIAALPGSIEHALNKLGGVDSVYIIDHAASWAYAIADAMLSERAKK